MSDACQEEPHILPLFKAVVIKVGTRCVYILEPTSLNRQYAQPWVADTNAKELERSSL